MSSYINTNLAALQTQRNLSTSQTAQQTAMSRLSSGLRVQSAKDDAAGFAIASNMDSKIRGQNVAIRNANDAISLTQTADGAMSQIQSSLQRMRELAVQAANDTNTSEDRVSLNTEFSQLQEEITRVTQNTKFNGQSLLSGAAADTSVAFSFQIGDSTGANDTITININNMATGAVAAATSSAITLGTDAASATAASATAAIDAIDAALKSVNEAAIKDGAVQNRLTSVISTLQVSVENQSAAKSRIMDADFAAETANMSRGQILQQAGMAMLSQANQLPNGVMALLR
ncbi:flagellin [Malikia sp.]|uniref:flagellin N-terminal helical domain-containing protein n=1 Tax=Malikia sp. TaxID=2070706 RepID=UPI002617E6B8|nr:flagellin [Malikia sp.]MDD2727891.1 flagellin [Malikia sp.]